MPNLGILPFGGTLVDQSTGVTTSGTSAVVTLPLAQSYRFMLEMLTFSATNLTLDVFLATSPDGTNYFEILHFAQVTTSGQGRQMLVRPYLGVGDAATEGAMPGLTFGVDGASGATAIVNNGPINPQFMKVRWVTGAAITTCQFRVRYMAVPPDAAD